MTICLLVDKNNDVLSMGTCEGDYIPIVNPTTLIEVPKNFDWEKKYKYEEKKLIEITEQ